MLNADDLNQLGQDVLERLYTSEQTSRRAQCSREDYAAGFVDLAVHLKLRMYFTPESWGEAK